MHKIWVVIKHEYATRVLKKSFILGTLTIPILIFIIIGITIWIAIGESSKLGFGYVDQSKVLAAANSVTQSDDYRVSFIAYSSPEEAQTALKNGEIQAFYIIPEDYLTTLQVDLFYNEDPPSSEILLDFDDFLRQNLLPGGPNPIQNRLIEGMETIIRSASGEREFREGVGFITILFPFAGAIFFFMAAMGTAGYFLQAITDEKENRTMEILVTSLSPEQLVIGKFVGLLGVSLSQMLIWIGTLGIGWLAVRSNFPELKTVPIPWDVLLLFLVFFLPSYALMAAIMAIIGSAVTELQEAQQVTGIVNLVFTFPMFLTALIFANPDSNLMVFLSLFPTTSFLTITLRWGFTLVPVWQLVVSWLLLTFTATVFVFLAARIFRFGMLQYGQKLSFSTIVSIIRRQKAQA